MQHRYVPDLGDFSKFAVIDALSGGGADRTALIWYLVDPHEVGDAHLNDGKHTAYLTHNRRELADCHPELYRRFRAVYEVGQKHVGVYERLGVSPNTVYFAEPLSYDGVDLPQRAAYRQGWLGRALAACAGAGLVVLDPDNGLAPPGRSISGKQGIKYATLGECRALYAGGERTLVVYQHGHRNGTIAQQADIALCRLTDGVEASRANAFALRFHRGTTRCYLVVPGRQQHQVMRGRAEQLIASAWGKRGHFSLIE